MGGREILGLAWGALRAHRLRSALTMLGIVIGTASVILLTSIGEGVRHYVLSEFTQFGSNILAINPGKVETTGLPGALGATVHKLTIDEAEALRRVPGVQFVVPVSIGQAEVRHGRRGRSVVIYGANSELPAVWKFRVGQGRFLPQGDPHARPSVVVLGPKLKRELFGDRNALGEAVRIAGQRFRVIGVMAPRGRLLGYDIDDSAYVPVARALSLFNQDGLFEIDVQFSHPSASGTVVEAVRRELVDRHEGEEDFTITAQSEMLEILDGVLRVVSAAVGGIGAISLVVGALGILTIMWISVNERTAEIGLAKALGATSGQVLGLYLAESILLSGLGGAIGVGLGLGLARTVAWAVPSVPVRTSPEFVIASLLVSVGVGLASGVLPARRAAALDPIAALRTE